MVARRSAKLFLIASPLVLLQGCTTLMSNVKGDFDCKAPSGTCAPSTVIDDQALATIGGVSGAVPAGPYLNGPNSKATVVAASGSHELRMIFAPMVDNQGRLNERSAIHISLQDPLSHPSQVVNLPANPTVLSYDAADFGSTSQGLAVGAGAGVQTVAVSAPLTPQSGFPDPSVVQAARDRAALKAQPTTADEIKAAVSAKIKGASLSPTPSNQTPPPALVPTTATATKAEVVVKAGSFSGLNGVD